MNQLCLELGDHLGGGKLIKRDNVGPDGSLSGSTFRDQHAESDKLITKKVIMLNLGYILIRSFCDLSPVPQLILTNDHYYEMLALEYIDYSLSAQNSLLTGLR